MSTLEIRSLRKKFGALEILKGIDISLEKGGFLVLVGPSGCGKSTLLNTIAGLEIDLVRRNPHRRPGRQRPTSLEARHRDGVPVLRALSEHVGRREHRVRHGDAGRSEARARKGRRCGRKDASDRASPDPPPSQLSGGQRQRVAMGRALVRQPQVFLFDEPLSNLDAKLRVDMRVEIKRLHQQTGTTIVYVTHDQIEAMTLATKIAVLKDGELQQVGSPHEIYNSPEQSVRRRFHGLAGDEPARRQSRQVQWRAPDHP